MINCLDLGKRMGKSEVGGRISKQSQAWSVEHCEMARAYRKSQNWLECLSGSSSRAVRDKVGKTGQGMEGLALMEAFVA